MRKISLNAKWFLSFAAVSLLVIATVTGCQNSSYTAPVETTQTSANPHSANGADLGHAMDVQNRHTDELMAIEGVNGTGAGVDEEGNPAVYVFTTNDHVHGIPDAVEDVHTHIQNIGEVKALNTLGVYSGTYRGPMSSGVSVGNDNECAAGTIGCVVTDAGGVNRFLLSNNHVFARINAAKIGEKIDQPGRYDMNCGASGQVANLSKFVPINFSRKSKNTVDCAIAQIFGAPGQTTTSIAGYTPTVTPEAASVGLYVEKTGRTTGQTTGNISAVNVTVSVSYGHGQTATFVNQLLINSGTFSGAGDSGSLIVDANNLNPVGLLFAGSSTTTIANPIGPVLSALGVTIVPN